MPFTLAGQIDKIKKISFWCCQCFSFKVAGTQAQWPGKIPGPYWQPATPKEQIHKDKGQWLTEVTDGCPCDNIQFKNWCSTEIIDNKSNIVPCR